MRRVEATRWLGVAAGIGALTGCRDAVAPSPQLSDRVAAYAVVENGSPIVRVLIDELFAVGIRGAVNGADAWVSGPDGTLPLTEAADSLPPCFVDVGPGGLGEEGGCYAVRLPRALASGDVLTLAITLADGTSIGGDVTIPGDPVASFSPASTRVAVEFRSLEDGGAFPIAIMPIHLEEAPGGERVDAVTSLEHVWINDTDLDLRTCDIRWAMTPFDDVPLEGTRDLLIYPVTCILDDTVALWDSVDVSVQAVAMEENYAAYVRSVLESSSFSLARAGFGIDGAVGVFGAVATTVLPLRLVYAP